ncbi:MAG: ergothioneine biosynthesis protein EgtB [Acidimicrobiales bacterium]
MASIDTDRELDLADAYPLVRSTTEWLAEPLGAEDQTVQSMPDVSPTKWHRAHVTWFFERFVLGSHLPGYRPYDAGFEFLFNSYYEAVGPRHPRAERGLITRPGVGEVMAYRQVVDDAMGVLLASGVSPEVAALVELGLHHEQQHQELLLMDIKHVLARNPTRVAYRPMAYRPTTPGPASDVASWVDVDGGLVEVGHAGDGFAYDNEGPRHRVWLEPYRIADRLVTCGEWKAFIDDGGYRRPELWLSEGWAQVNAQGWDAPLYWRRGDDDRGGPDAEWCRFTLAGPGPVLDAEPVCHVSHFEADAYATWAGARLPTEFEWEHAVTSTGAAADAGHRLAWHPRAAGPADGSLRQWCGEVWQWTASAYLPYHGFRPAAGAVGEYNGKFMSNQMVLRGGACITPVGHTRATYRNFFPSSSRWMFGGVRLAADA